MSRSAHLWALLDAFAPSTPNEAAAVLATRRLLRSPDPFSRFARPGHVTASAVLFAPDATRVALIWHEKLRRALQPGGHVEPDDANVLEAAWRELQEETGVTRADVALMTPHLVGVDVHAIPENSKEGAHVHHDLRFAFRLTSDRVLPLVRWTLPDDLDAGLKLAVARVLA
ncbi:NUDIX hydrolase [Deinococcus yavapaiensis]|uniref:NUDIX domain-containing protein n=1 Tax=Deinococcus yavapaiensis KR-236 TaxID=694435 RepID=A0A318S4A2_9DEIO|nr:NUDIX domain-containing protein [Deinococcus yavapaiensis]PYE49972.1 NUDIX domain-containing protein [Deinococcus yavapaiensis KR-236]